MVVGSNKGLQQAIDSLIKAERPLAVIVGDGNFNIRVHEVLIIK